MALDTAQNRASALCVGSPWRGVLPPPTGSVTQGDRQHVADMYAGVLASAPQVSEITTYLGSYTA